jgi:hypothetical protein
MSGRRPGALSWFRPPLRLLGMRRYPMLAVCAVLALAACKTEIVGFSDADVIVLRMDVTGGIAGVDYTFELQDDGAVLGIRCARVCDFLPGDTLGRLTPAQRLAVKAAVAASGLDEAGGTVDFGTECCDQFTYRVTYTSGTVVRSFSGSSEALPGSLRELVRTLHLLYLDTPPLIVSESAGLDGFSLDPVDILAARVSAGVLEVDVTYGGGCAAHDLDAVAWTGWMESNPVQVGLAVTHDARGDPCDALVRRTLRFDLEPLRDAYVAAYGAGNATLILRVEAGSGAPGGTPTTVTYSF